jgi:hypothetical protein
LVLLPRIVAVLVELIESLAAKQPIALRRADEAMEGRRRKQSREANAQRDIRLSVDWGVGVFVDVIVRRNCGASAKDLVSGIEHRRKGAARTITRPRLARRLDEDQRAPRVGRSERPDTQPPDETPLGRDLEK